MNLDGIKVNHAALEKAVDDMRSTVNQIDNRMNTLEGQLNGLKNGWAGNARQSYDVAKAKWDQAIQDMRELLNETHQSVTMSNQEYAAADKRGAAQFGGN